MLLAQKCLRRRAASRSTCTARVWSTSSARRPGEAARERANLLLDLLTPIAKSWPSQWCLEANSLAIQVHGGYGYTRDYTVEQFYRDNRLNPIHEGTHGIQGLDLLGRKVRMQGGRALALFAEEVAATVARAERAGGEWAAAGRAIVSARERLDAVATKLHGLGDLDRTLANASVFLEAFGHVAVAWIWLEQALCAHAALGRGGAQLHADEQAFYSGKLQAARFFMRWELPKTGPMIELLDSADTTTLEMRDAWF